MILITVTIIIILVIINNTNLKRSLSKALLSGNLSLKSSSKSTGKHKQREAKIASFFRYIPAEALPGKTANHPPRDTFRRLLQELQ